MLDMFVMMGTLLEILVGQQERARNQGIGMDGLNIAIVTFSFFLDFKNIIDNEVRILQSFLSGFWMQKIFFCILFCSVRLHIFLNGQINFGQ